MEFSPKDREILSHLKEARASRQDLGDVLEFYEKLFLQQFTFKSRLRSSGRGDHWVKREVDIASLANGSAQVVFEELEIQTTPFLDLYREIAQLVIPYLGTAEGLEAEPPAERILGWAQEIFLGRGPLIASGDSADQARTVSGFVLAPYLQLASEVMLPKVPLNLWYRGYCPICGGLPVFAALISDTSPRTLFCPRCHAEWSFNRIGCPFCKSNEAQTYYVGDEAQYRLYVCEACNRYLKTVDMRERRPEGCLPVECLVTVSMDLAAREKGFTP